MRKTALKFASLAKKSSGFPGGLQALTSLRQAGMREKGTGGSNQIRAVRLRVSDVGALNTEFSCISPFFTDSLLARDRLCPRAATQTAKVLPLGIEVLFGKS